MIRAPDSRRSRANLQRGGKRGQPAVSKAGKPGPGKAGTRQAGKGGKHRSGRGAGPATRKLDPTRARSLRRPPAPRHKGSPAKGPQTAAKGQTEGPANDASQPAGAKEADQDQESEQAEESTEATEHDEESKTEEQEESAQQTESGQGTGD
jgi:hypothetical protein